MSYDVVDASVVEEDGVGVRRLTDESSDIRLLHCPSPGTIHFWGLVNVVPQILLYKTINETTPFSR